MLSDHPFALCHIGLPSSKVVLLTNNKRNIECNKLGREVRETSKILLGLQTGCRGLLKGTDRFLSLV